MNIEQFYLGLSRTMITESPRKNILEMKRLLSCRLDLSALPDLEYSTHISVTL